MMTSTAHLDDCSVSFPDLFALDRSLLAHLFAYFLSWIEQSLYVDRFLSNIAVLFLFSHVLCKPTPLRDSYALVSGLERRMASACTMFLC